jgi:hypothetical protein
MTDAAVRAGDEPNFAHIFPPLNRYLISSTPALTEPVSLSPYVFYEKMLRSNCGGGMGPLACNSFVMQIPKALVNRIAGVEVQEASSVSKCNLRATAVLIWWVSRSPGEEPIELFAWEKALSGS